MTRSSNIPVGRKLFAIGIIILSALVIVIIGILKYVALYVSDNNTGFSFLNYLVYENFVQIGVFLMVLGLILLLKKFKSLLLFCLITFGAIFWIQNKHRVGENLEFELTKVYYPYEFSIERLLTDLNAKEFQKIVNSNNEETTNSTPLWYPFEFEKQEVQYAIKQHISLGCLPTENYRNKKEDCKVNRILLRITSVNGTDVDNSETYKTMKQILEKYRIELNDYYNKNSLVNYPYYRTFSWGGEYGQGSSFKIEKKEDMISYGWDNNQVSTSLALLADIEQDPNDLSNDNVVIEIGSHQMYIVIEHLIHYDRI